MDDTQVVDAREKGFCQLQPEDFERDGDYWLHQLWWAEQQGLIFPGTKSVLFGVFLEILLAQREG